MTLNSIFEHLSAMPREQLLAHGSIFAFTALLIIVRFAAAIFRFLLKVVLAAAFVVFLVHALRDAKTPSLNLPLSTAEEKGSETNFQTLPQSNPELPR